MSDYLIWYLIASYIIVMVQLAEDFCEDEWTSQRGMILTIWLLSPLSVFIAIFITLVKFFNWLKGNGWNM